jgi:hypothetical protein
MRLHLIFEADLVMALKAALEKREHVVSGMDYTLEQFRDYVSVHPIEAELVLADGRAGMGTIADSIQRIKDIRMTIPHIRMIVVLPQDAATDWIQAIGRLGIYDVHCTNQFGIQDVLEWMEHPRTPADVWREEALPDGKVGQEPPPVLKKDKTVIREPPLIEERIIGTVPIGVAGVSSRVGCTHVALSMAIYLARVGRTALVECQGQSLRSLWPGQEPETWKKGVTERGVKLYSGLEKGEWLPILTLGYQYVVLDFGHIATADEGELMRCPQRFFVAQTSPWDMERLSATLESYLDRYQKQTWRVLLNLTDENRFEELDYSLSRKEKDALKLHLYRYPYQPDVEKGVAHESWLQEVLPKVRPQSSRRFFSWKRKS